MAETAARKPKPGDGRPDATGSLKAERAEGGVVLKFAGRWDIATVSKLDSSLRDYAIPADGDAKLDLGEVSALDSSGAWAIYRLWKRLRDEGRNAEIANASDAHKALIERLQKELEKEGDRNVRPRRPNPILHTLDELGANTLRAWSEAKDLLSFFGMIVVGIGRSIAQPSRIRWTATINQMERTGLNALPIVGLLSFLIGVVLA